MAKEAYRKLCEAMSKCGGSYPGPQEAIQLVERPGAQVPLVDKKALKEAIKVSQA